MSDGRSGLPFVPIAMAAAAFCFGTSALLNCRAVEFPPIDGTGSTIDAGLYSYRTKGYLATDDSLWVVDICRSYNDIDEVFGFDYETDRLTRALENMGVAIPVVGGIALLGACISPCIQMSPMVWKLFGVMFLSLCILQGVSLMILDSTICVDNPVLQYLAAEYPEIREEYGDTCEWGIGFRLAITATVFWGVAGIATLAIAPPKRDGAEPAGLPESERMQVEDAAKEEEAEQALTEAE